MSPWEFEITWGPENRYQFVYRVKTLGTDALIQRSAQVPTCEGKTHKGGIKGNSQVWKSDFLEERMITEFYIKIKSDQFILILDSQN